MIAPPLYICCAARVRSAAIFIFDEDFYRVRSGNKQAATARTGRTGRSLFDPIDFSEKVQIWKSSNTKNIVPQNPGDNRATRAMRDCSCSWKSSWKSTGFAPKKKSRPALQMWIAGEQLGVRDLWPSSSSSAPLRPRRFASVQKWTGNSRYSRSDSRYSMQWLGDTHTGYDTEKPLTQLQWRRRRSPPTQTRRSSAYLENVNAQGYHRYKRRASSRGDK